MEREETALSGEDFDAATYVRQYLDNARVREGDETKLLLQLRSRMNALHTESSNSMKKNVSLNYRQFISTSKQISHLENEIYQLSFLLGEQKSLIEQMLDLTGQTHVATNNNNQGKSHAAITLQNLIHKIDGIAVALAAVDNSVELLLEGEFTVLDDSLQPTTRTHVTLLTDRILFSRPSQPGGVKWRYHLQSSHSLNALAAVNVKDERLHVFKLLIFPEQHYLSCESSKTKHDWLEAIDRAKKRLLQSGSLVRQATIRGKRASQRDSTTGGLKPHNELRAEVSLVSEGDELAWLKELPGELDVLIGHRDLDQAVEMALEARAALADGANPAIEAEIRIRERRLVELLSEQVKRPSGGATNGPRGAARKAVALLRALGRGGTAIELYLRRRSTGARIAVRELRVSEDPLRYIRELCTLFLNATILDVIAELHGRPEHGAVLLQWTSQELSAMIALVRRQVIDLNPSMAVLAHTYRIVNEHCKQLPAAGIDLSFQLNRLLSPAVFVAMDANFKNTIDALRMRFSTYSTMYTVSLFEDDKWHAYTLEPEYAFNRFMEEMSDMGFRLDWALKSSRACCLLITATACHFARVASVLARDLGQLRLAVELVGACDERFVQFWREMLAHIAKTPSSTVRDHTATFIAAQVLPLCESTYDSSESESCHLLSDLLATEFPSLIQIATSSSSTIASANLFEELGQV